MKMATLFLSFAHKSLGLKGSVMDAKSALDLLGQWANGEFPMEAKRKLVKPLAPLSDLSGNQKDFLWSLASPSRVSAFAAALPV
ncbi:hypothetical protein LCGC14_2634660, partial [marine sediment metagenome]